MNRYEKVDLAYVEGFDGYLYAMKFLRAELKEDEKLAQVNMQVI